MWLRSLLPGCTPVHWEPKCSPQASSLSIAPSWEAQEASLDTICTTTTATFELQLGLPSHRLHLHSGLQVTCSLTRPKQSPPYESMVPPSSQGLRPNVQESKSSASLFLPPYTSSSGATFPSVPPEHSSVHPSSAATLQTWAHRLPQMALTPSQLPSSPSYFHTPDSRSSQKDLLKKIMTYTYTCTHTHTHTCTRSDN